MGASFPPLKPRGESGKSQRSNAGKWRSHFHVDKSVCLKGEVARESKAEKHWGFEREEEGNLFGWVSSTPTLLWQLLKLVEWVTSRKGVSLECWHERICEEHSTPYGAEAETWWVLVLMSTDCHFLKKNSSALKYAHLFSCQDKISLSLPSDMKLLPALSL